MNKLILLAVLAFGSLSFGSESEFPEILKIKGPTNWSGNTVIDCIGTVIGPHTIITNSYCSSVNNKISFYDNKIAICEQNGKGLALCQTSHRFDHFAFIHSIQPVNGLKIKSIGFPSRTRVGTNIYNVEFKPTSKVFEVREYSNGGEQFNSVGIAGGHMSDGGGEPIYANTLFGNRNEIIAVRTKNMIDGNSLSGRYMNLLTDEVLKWLKSASVEICGLTSDCQPVASVPVGCEVEGEIIADLEKEFNYCAVS